MSAKLALNRVVKNPSTMSNTQLSAKELSSYDQCRGIHGAARQRKGVKKGTNSARRRLDKKIIDVSMDEM